MFVGKHAASLQDKVRNIVLASWLVTNRCCLWTPWFGCIYCMVWLHLLYGKAWGTVLKARSSVVQQGSAQACTAGVNAHELLSPLRGIACLVGPQGSCSGGCCCLWFKGGSGLCTSDGVIILSLCLFTTCVFKPCRLTSSPSMPKLSSRYKGHPISTAHPASIPEILSSLISEVSQESLEGSAAMIRPKFCSFSFTRVSALKGVKANEFTSWVLTPSIVNVLQWGLLPV